MDLDDYLDPPGQQPGLNLYTQICLCYSVADDSLHPGIIKTLKNGLERLSAGFPWIAGQLINEGAGESNTGTFKIIPLEKTPRLIVKDLRGDPSVPTMAVLRQANFPSSMLDESLICPRNTVPATEPTTPSDTPVFLVQANFITGGLLLTFVGQHNTMDMTGQGQVIHLLSKACRNEAFTSEELSTGNLARRNLIPLIENYKQGPELESQILKAPPAQPVSEGAAVAPAPPPKSTWAYFTFSRTSLTALKALATKSLSSGYISTDDALSAFIWQSVIRARLPRLDAAANSTFARAVDVRSFMHVPKTYPGLMQNMTFHGLAAKELVEEPLGAVAANLRAAVDAETSNLAYHTRALATYLHHSPDKSVVNLVATINLSSDVMLSSWAKVDCYDLDFGLGVGKPVSVRRPRFVPFESLLYLMPRALDGEIALNICLRDEDMERLRADEEFTKYGTYIG